MAIKMGTSANDRLFGTWKQDVIFSYGGSDFLDGRAGADLMAGGRRNDVYIVDNAQDDVIEEAGGGRADMVKSRIGFELPDFVENLRLLGNKNLAGMGNELSNQIIGNSGNNRLSGDEGSDKLAGAAGNDAIWGGDGKDLLRGGDGNDRLIGGYGGDVLHGGDGADRFIFTSFVDSTSGRSRDTIADFSQSQGDRIDLRKMDSNIMWFGDGSFQFIGTIEFEVRNTLFDGEVRYERRGGNTVIEADIDYDDEADFSILVKGIIDFRASDFIL